MKSPIVRNRAVSSSSRLQPSGKETRIGSVGFEQVGDDPLRFLAHGHQLGRIVEPVVEEALQRPLLLGQLG